MHPHRLHLLSLALLVVACHDERPSPHVYASPPPRTAPAVAGVSAPELPLGAKGPGAQITSVLDAATGTPASLGAAKGTLSVLGVVALGPGNWGDGADMRMDLAVRGTRELTIAHALGSPAPKVVAHAFELPVDSLGAGTYSIRVRLLRAGSRVVVESVPVFLTVP